MPIRKRAAPSGMSRISSNGSADRTGLGCNRSTIWLRSVCQLGIFRALAFRASGAASEVNGSGGTSPGFRTISNEPAGSWASSTRP